MTKKEKKNGRRRLTGKRLSAPTETDTDRDGETSVVVERAAEADEWREDADAAGGDDDVDRYRHQRVAHQRRQEVLLQENPDADADQSAAYRLKITTSDLSVHYNYNIGYVVSVA